MPRLIRWRDGTAREGEDPFTRVDDDQPIVPGDIIVSLARFRAEGGWLGAAPRRLGVRLLPDEPVEGLEGDLEKLEVIALEFPRFRDGRPFSAARILRERLGWRGELRAVGEVLLEQAKFMIRCRFDAFEPADGSSARAWTAAGRRFRHVYQRAADGREPAFAERAAR